MKLIETELTDEQLEMVTGGYNQHANEHEGHESEKKKSEHEDFHHLPVCHWTWFHHHWVKVCKR